jgi:hypothetical protein
VDDRFGAKEWSDILAEERPRRCRLMAEEAQKLAQDAPDHLSKAYLRIAQAWLQLADDMERAG